MYGLKSHAAVFKSWIQIRIRIEPEPKNCAWLKNRNFEEKDNINPLSTSRLNLYDDIEEFTVQLFSVQFS